MAPTSPPAGAIASTVDDDLKKRVGKKLQKKRKDDHMSAMELPDRLREPDDTPEEDLTVAQGAPMFMHMNQSIFGLIAAAGSRVDFHDRFDGQSSDEDDEDENDVDGRFGDERRPRRRQPAMEPNISRTMLFKKPSTSSKGDRHRRKLSEHKLLRSLPALPRLSKTTVKKESSKSSSKSSKKDKPPYDDDDDDDDDESSSGHELTREGSRLAPVMSRILEARAEMSARPSFDLERKSGEAFRLEEPGESGPSPLARKLKEIFEFEVAEEVIEGMATNERSCDPKSCISA
jgi:sterol 3beta-glucosyltransferase